MKTKSYRKLEQEKLSQYKKTVLGISENGLSKWGNPHSHLLPENKWSHNLWVGIRNKAIEYIENNNIDPHSKKNLTSSQILCFNIFLPFNENPSPLNSYFLKIKDFKTIVAKSMKFEYNNRELLNEKGKPTNVDLVLEWKDTNDLNNLFLFEFKYTEDGFTHCSKYNPQLCNRYFEIQNNPNTCYLDSIGTSYWKLILKNIGPIDITKIPTDIECPFQKDFYQLMRNQLLAHKLEQQEDYNRVIFGVIYPQENKELQNTRNLILETSNSFETWEKLIRDKGAFIQISIEEFLASIYRNLPDDMQNWKSFLNIKHGFSLR